jgi:signal peptidase I
VWRGGFGGSTSDSDHPGRALLCCASLTVLFGTLFNICSMDADGSMAPSIPQGDWIVGLTPPVMGTIHRGDVVAFPAEWYPMDSSRVVGLPGDRIQVKSGRLIRNGLYVPVPKMFRTIFAGGVGQLMERD